MAKAYVDTSCAVAVALGEPATATVLEWLGGFDELVSSNLLEAELAATLQREGLWPRRVSMLEQIRWILPRRTLSGEIARVLEAGCAKGADCWHIANALYASPTASELTFATLDDRQRSVAEKVGFQVAH